MTTKQLQRKQTHHDKNYWNLTNATRFENIRHLTLHLGKCIGTLSSYCEAKEREKGYPDDELVREVIPDLLSCALRLSNWLECDISLLYDERLKDIKKRTDEDNAKRQKYRNSLPESVIACGFDFYWDNEKVWKIKAPVTTCPLADLEWHFDIPFLWEGEGTYNLKARDVIEHPEQHREEYDRMLRADMTHPIDCMENKGRLVILDGLHRLMNAFVKGSAMVCIRVIPRKHIPDIL